jgi:hypothetical protein
LFNWTKRSALVKAITTPSSYITTKSASIDSTSTKCYTWEKASPI